MRILHVSPFYLPAVRYGGPIYAVHGLCAALAAALAAAGHEVHVFTTNIDGKADSDVPLNRPIKRDGVIIRYFPCHISRRLFYAPAMRKALRDEIKSFDLVHLHSVYLWPTWAAARVARRAGVPYCLSPLGMLVKELIHKKSRWVKTAWITLIEKKNVEKAAAIHVTSPIEATALRAFNFRLPPLFTIPNAVDLPQPWKWEELSQDVRQVLADRQPYVLYFGRINWKKGLDRLLAAWRTLDINVKLVIAGNDDEDYLPALQKIALKNNITDRIIFLPRFISGPDKEALYARAKLFALPSLSENFGNTVLEAMIRAVPVVVTEEVGARYLVEQAGAGKVVPATQLTGAIADLLADDSLLTAMGSKGRDLALKNFGWEQVAKEMLIRYKEIIKSPARHAT